MPPEIGRTGCPYFHCSALVTTVTSRNPTTGVTTTILVEHDIQHPILSGACIASLMSIPISVEVQQHFDKRQALDTMIINRRLGLKNNAIPNLGQGPRPPLPTGVSVATIEEIIGNLNIAATQGGEAIAELQNMQNGLDIVLSCIGQARDKIDYLSGNVTTTLLTEYSGVLSRAHEQAAALNAQIQEIKNLINHGQEQGNEFIGRMLG